MRINEAKTIENFIPYALKLEDKTVFQGWMQNQAEFLASHRNIQLNLNKVDFYKSHNGNLLLADVKTG